MSKKIALILSLIMLLSASLVACGNKDLDPTKNAGIKIQDTTNDVDDYYYNPKIEAASKVDDTTVRVKFSMQVGCPTYNVARFTYVSSELFGTKIQAKSFKCLDAEVLGDADACVYGKYYEFTFESAIPEDGYICFEETLDTDNDGALDNVLCDDSGSGIYAEYRPNDESAPIAAARYTNTEMRAPKLPTVLLRAYVEDKASSTFVVEFTKPVACLDASGAPASWIDYTYIADRSFPEPSKDSYSWSLGATNEPLALDPQFSDDGNIYATKWKFTMNSEFAFSNYEEGVFVICENNSLADINFPDESDNNHLGRLIVDIDGKPLEAGNSNKTGTDAAYCKFSTNEAFKINY